MTTQTKSNTPFVDSKIVEQQKRGHIVRTQYNVPVEMIFAEDARRLEELKNKLEEALKAMSLKCRSDDPASWGPEQPIWINASSALRQAKEFNAHE